MFEILSLESSERSELAEIGFWLGVTAVASWLYSWLMISSGRLDIRIEQMQLADRRLNRPVRSYEFYRRRHKRILMGLTVPLVLGSIAIAVVLLTQG